MIRINQNTKLSSHMTLIPINDIPLIKKIMLSILLFLDFQLLLDNGVLVVNTQEIYARFICAPLTYVQ